MKRIKSVKRSASSCSAVSSRRVVTLLAINTTCLCISEDWNYFKARLFAAHQSPFLGVLDWFPGFKLDSGLGLEPYDVIEVFMSVARKLDAGKMKTQIINAPRHACINHCVMNLSAETAFNDMWNVLRVIFESSMQTETALCSELGTSAVAK